MRIESAIFDRSCPTLAECPDESMPEFAFIGRSNVGKSSLLNFLAGKDGLARVSPRPGFTRMINIFVINRLWRLVDLPGYGFAQGAKRDKVNFNRAVGTYLKKRPNLTCVFLLIDSGLEPQVMDVEFVEWLAKHAVPFVLVFTKVDKNSATVVDNNIAAFLARIQPWFVQLPAYFKCSSVSGEGRAELLGMIDETLKAIYAESNQIPAAEGDEMEMDEDEPSPSAAKPKAEAPRKHRPDLQRPW